MQVAKEVQTQIARSNVGCALDKHHSPSPASWSVNVKGQETFTFDEKQVSTVGTRSFNDIVLSSNVDRDCTVSRLHVVFLPLPETGHCFLRVAVVAVTKEVLHSLGICLAGQLLVCDVGSLNGIKFVERSKPSTADICDADNGISKPGSRSTLVSLSYSAHRRDRGCCTTLHSVC